MNEKQYQESTNLVAESRRDQLIDYLGLRGVYGPGFKRVIDELFEKTDYFYGPSSTRWHNASRRLFFWL